MNFNLPKMNFSVLKQIILLGLLLFYLFIIGSYFLKQFQEGMDNAVEDAETTEIVEETETPKPKEEATLAEATLAEATLAEAE
jgi:hypothetical protein